MAIGHARYSTTGSTAWRTPSRSCSTRRGRTVALGHNGNLTNTTALRDELREQRVRLRSTSDTEVIAALIAQHPSPRLDDAVADTMGRIEGAFAAVVLTEDAVAGFRDPDGIRPLVVGRLDDSLGAGLRDLRARHHRRPGRARAQARRAGRDRRPTGARFGQAVEPRAASRCASSSTSTSPGRTPRWTARRCTRCAGGWASGWPLEAPVEADVVIAVPDSGTPAAIGLRARQRHPVRRRPGQEPLRRPHVHPARPGAARARRAAQVQPAAARCCAASAWSSSTTRSCAARRRASSCRCCSRRAPPRCTCASRSPPIISPCFYGIDMADQDELIAAGRTIEEVRERLGATSLAYLSLDGPAGVDQPARRALLPGLPDRRVPDRDPRRHATRQAALRGAGSGRGRGRSMSDERAAHLRRRRGQPRGRRRGRRAHPRRRRPRRTRTDVLGGLGGFAGLYTPSARRPRDRRRLRRRRHEDPARRRGRAAARARHRPGRDERERRDHHRGAAGVLPGRDHVRADRAGPRRRAGRGHRRRLPRGRLRAARRRDRRAPRHDGAGRVRHGRVRGRRRRAPRPDRRRSRQGRRRRDRPGVERPALERLLARAAAAGARRRLARRHPLRARRRRRWPTRCSSRRASTPALVRVADRHPRRARDGPHHRRRHPRQPRPRRCPTGSAPRSTCPAGSALRCSPGWRRWAWTRTRCGACSTSASATRWSLPTSRPSSALRTLEQAARTGLGGRPPGRGRRGHPAVRVGVLISGTGSEPAGADRRRRHRRRLRRLRAGRRRRGWSGRRGPASSRW